MVVDFDVLVILWESGWEISLVKKVGPEPCGSLMVFG
jgi:hypothetical protein